ELQNVEQGCELGRVGARRDKPHIVLYGPPQEQTRLLEDYAQSSRSRAHDGSLIVGIEAGNDPEHRRLAASGRADQHADQTAVEAESYIAQNFRALAGDRHNGFPDDADFKPSGAANGTRVAQGAAPTECRSR